jgi:hypothetical protein
MPFAEVFMSIHLLLGLTSLCVGGKWFLEEPSLKLRLIRLIFLSCIFSPMFVHVMKKTDKPFLEKYISIDNFSTKMNLDILDFQKKKEIPIHSQDDSHLRIVDLRNLIFFMILLGRFFQGRRLFQDLSKLRKLLRKAIPLRSHGKVSIVVSDRCLIPFSTRFLRRAYIVLPVSLFSSSERGFALGGITQYRFNIFNFYLLHCGYRRHCSGG